MRGVVVAALHVAIWLFSIPLFGSFVTWLAREKRIDTPDWVHCAYLSAMLAWALWIFGRCFSYRPASLGRVLGFAVYVGVIGCAAAVGLLLEYIVIVMYLGGE